MTRYSIIQLILMAAAAGALLFFDHPIAASIVGGMAVFFTALAVLAPSASHTIEEMGRRLGSLLGSAIGTVLLTLVYFAVFLPGSLWLRLRGVDLLNRGFPTRGRSNWIERVGYGADLQIYRKLYSRPHAARPGREPGA